MLDDDEMDDLRAQDRHDRKRAKNDSLDDRDPNKEHGEDEDEDIN